MRFLRNIERSVSKPTLGAPADPKRACPDGASINVLGEHYVCDQMDQMDERCDSHDGWAHSSKAVQTIWQGNS